MRSISRPKPLVLTLMLAVLIPLPVVAFQEAVPTSPERSTAQIETSIEPPSPPPPTRIELPADRLSTVHEGKASASSPAHRVVAVPPDRMIEIRVASPGSAASLSIFRGDSAEAEPGSARASGAIGWISSTGDGGDLRILIWTASVDEVAFRLLVKVHAADPPAQPPAVDDSTEE
jgi:hypothetical protein